MRKKKALINICFSLLLQVITVVSGFVLPRLIIEVYGSNSNGLVNSIASFIAYITLLQSGVGGVIRAALYKPLAKEDHGSLCVIVKTTEIFFRKIAYATVAYIVILSIVFPLFFAKEFDFLYSFSLVIIIGISTAAQYFFGITYQMLLEADQRSYVYSITQIVTVVLNTICSVLLIKAGCSLQIVKLISSLFFVLRPIVINQYARRKYRIKKNVEANNEVIAQRWDGVAQAIAYFVHSKTDVFVLTIFSVLSNVSIYSVYAMVTAGLTSLIECVDKAVRAAFGNIIAKEEKDNLSESFNAYNWLIHVISTTFFSTACITILSFVSVYTRNISDANYQQRLFGILLLTAEFIYCLRMPYNTIITSAGKYRETKKSAYIEATLNICISCVFVKVFGLVGVAIGTLCAMVYRTISFIGYLHKDILFLSVQTQIKRFLVTIIAYALPTLLFGMFEVKIYTYAQWIVYASIVFLLDLLMVILINLLLCKKETMKTIKILVGRRRQ